MKIFLIMMLISFELFAAKPGVKFEQCLAAREYITTISFLRDKKEYQMSEEQIRKISNEVSNGCTGASGRFIKILKVLTKMGIDSSSAVSAALSFAASTNDHANAFIEIFRKAYDSKFLDLDVLASMKISLRLSSGFQGDVKKSLKDFNKIVEFCLKSKSMELSGSQCAQIATEFAALGEKYQAEVAKPFEKLIKFLQDDKKGPKLDRNNSLALAKRILSHGPKAEENFSQAFKFSVAKNGLGLPIPEALKQAETLASKSYKPLESHSEIKTK